MSDAFLRAVVARAVSFGLTEVEAREACADLALTKALEAVRGHRRGALLLLGPPGTGKTTAAHRWLLATSIDPRNWNHDGSSWWFRYPGATRLSRTSRSLAYLKQYDSRDVETVVGARALVLDDLGQEYLDKSGFLASLLDHVVSERHRRGLPTVVTANLTWQEFEAAYGARVGDRVGENLVVCDGASLRRGAPEKRPVRGVDPAAAAARAAECEAAIVRSLAPVPGALSRTPEPVATRGAEDGKMTDEQVAARKAELERQMLDWRRRTAAGG